MQNWGKTFHTLPKKKVHIILILPTIQSEKDLTLFTRFS